MPNAVLQSLRATLDRLKALPMYQKGPPAEQALETALAILTDHENRLSRLEGNADVDP